MRSRTVLLQAQTTVTTASGGGTSGTLAKFTGSTTIGDSTLLYDSTNTLALRNSTSAQALNIYNTYTDATTYEALKLLWASNVAVIGTYANGGTLRPLRLTTNSNSNYWEFSAVTPHMVPSTDNSFTIGDSTHRAANVFSVIGSFGATAAATTLTDKFTKYNNVNSAGWGVPSIYAAGRVTTQSASVTLTTYTVGAADGSFDVGANILVTTATGHLFTVVCNYTDEGNTARSLTLPFCLLAATTTTTTVNNLNGAVPYHGIPLNIRAKAATSITLVTSGTFTTVVYNGEGFIVQKA